MFVKVFFSWVLPVLTLYGWTLSGKYMHTPKEIYAWTYQLAIQAVWWTSALMIMDWWRWGNTGLFTIYFIVKLVRCIRARQGKQPVSIRINVLVHVLTLVIA
jgi:hypothetical protein